jgi:hypothetical protein
MLAAGFGSHLAPAIARAPEKIRGAAEGRFGVAQPFSITYCSARSSSRSEYPLHSPLRKYMMSPSLTM